MSNTLYIVGNGFDLHHGVASRYVDFGNFLETVDPDTYEMVDRYFVVDDSFWWEFEDRLAELDSGSVIDDASGFLMSYGDDEWSDSGHHDFQYEVNRSVSAISQTMRSRFGDWIRQLRIPSRDEAVSRMLPLDPAARFLNFNYTPTLQTLYGVSPDRVLHIHGSAAASQDQLVLGHGRDPGVLDPYRYERNPEEADTRVVEGISLVDQYFRDTFKPTERILHEQSSYFEALNDLNRIIVLGHSLADVDMPYFRTIKRNARNDARWSVSYFGESAPVRSAVAGLGIPGERAEFFTLADPFMLR
jgi:hypothetical protein